MPVKCKHPGWESKIGAICAINGDKVMVEFGKHDFVEFYSDELVAMTGKSSVSCPLKPSDSAPLC